jgi:cell fate regulator YaaT (PSP1 superfamily)
MEKIVGIRFQKIGKLYHFNAENSADIQPGDFAIVETSRGRQIGQVIAFIEDPPRPPKGTWKHIDRKATARDLLIKQELGQKELAVMIDCRAKASELGFEGVKIVKAEYSFDGDRLAFLYNSEGEEDVDLSRLVKAMQKENRNVRIEMRRIGPRDVAKIIGGMGACGMENRCCSKFLTEFSPISIRMAKEQGVSLDPSEITGMCGRLRCCLIYEYEQYVEARKQLPKRRKRVITPLGEGKVLDIIPLKQAVIVRLEDGEGTVMEFLKDEIQPWEELKALEKKAQEPCDKHENGECDCGKAKDSE